MESFLQFDFKDRPLSFSEPLEIVTADYIHEVQGAFERIEKALEKGYYAAGFIAYEAAPAFDPAYKVHGNTKTPLVWFGIYEQAHVPKSRVYPNGGFQVGEWKMDIDMKEYGSGINQIKNAIEAGDTYQVNYTARMKASFHGDEYAFYQQLYKNQQGAYSAYLDIGDYAVLSASPELFFQIRDRQIIAKPMKGTARRGKTVEEDQLLVNGLTESEKERAENLMIVDLLRNDIGRIAKPGTVTVPQLFEVEKYPTVHQMTSTIKAELEEGKRVFDWFEALFPCGSITGAPKISTMEYINELEQSPRGIYCGAIGYITPYREAIFNVPIRTVVLDKREREAIYGAGGGITWDSTAEGEYEELQTKARLLTERRKVFQLLESIKLEEGQFPLLKYHLKRLSDSARYFGFLIDISRVINELDDIADKIPSGTHKVRLLMDHRGEIHVESAPVIRMDSIKYSLADRPINTENSFLYHKTTNREAYESHVIRAPERADVVLLYNENNELTEFTIGNIVVESEGEYFTPPVSCGLLQGTYRQKLLDEKVLREKVIKKKHLFDFDSVWMINSVRGWVKAQII
ncbi:aminodeoxychorismate synthase component I [Thalassobacillus pellis]|uniref:aminodeoxychorismate synthase component I n=1 Tax=Thalassobacillus pellis TaxID=748008 RepID=UPI00195F2CF9|nr:aminodeoxychorismate synthase component I [Thalassobacillus pellis]MBM7551999.1 para-aminobenzoate synthetase/4-amino-4-deoxychorismate lyase [Thalassobacillus pellis]